MLINNVTHQRETLTEWPIRLPLMTLLMSIRGVRGLFFGVGEQVIFPDFISWREMLFPVGLETPILVDPKQTSVGFEKCKAKINE